MKDRDPGDVPDLFGLVLAGGRSRRFGFDKAAVDVDGQTLLARTVDLLRSVLSRVFVSVRADQTNDELRKPYPLIVDEAPELGPAGGMLAAHRRHADVAWLIVACDMPGLDEAAVRNLVQSRNAARAATAYRSPDDGGAEPLCAIYEPATLARFAQQAEAGQSFSPRELLAKSDVEIVALSDAGMLANVNRPADLVRREHRGKG